MNDFDREILDLMVDFGFEHYRIERSSYGLTQIYHYQPSYLDVGYYSLKLFSYKNGGITDHTLYIHGHILSSTLYMRDSDSEDNRNYIKEQIEEIFPDEIRMHRIKKILE